MSIQFNCQKCGKWLKADVRHAGKRAKCTGCGADLFVPDRAERQAAVATISTAAPAAADEGESSDEPILLRKRPPEDDALDMTPMVDVTFLLLIFFMITAAFSLQKALEMPTPDSTEGASVSRTIEEIEADDNYVVVRIDKDNSVWVNDESAPSEQSLLSKLRTALRDRGANKMLVLANGEARHDTVVMALDAGTAVGMEDVRLSDSEDDL